MSTNTGDRLRIFRKSFGLSVRAAATQLHVTHVALGSWEDGAPPEPAFRDAIEVWTSGAIKVSDWTPAPREQAYQERAALVRPAVRSDHDSGPLPIVEDETAA
jgi:transcriptional regulator with XRE-family HTH domain